jgi:hypothetical protein
MVAPTKRVNTFGTFLATLAEQQSEQPPPQTNAPPSNVTARILELMSQHSASVDVRELLERSGADVIEFGKALEKLQSLDAVTLTHGATESVTLGPKWKDVLSLFTA